MFSDFKAQIAHRYSSSSLLSRQVNQVVKFPHVSKLPFSTAFSTFDETPSFVEIEFSQDDRTIKSYAFLDQGAQGLLVSPHVLKQGSFDTQPVTQEVTLHFMDGTPAKIPKIQESVVGKLKIGNHEEFLEFGITETT